MEPITVNCRQCETRLEIPPNRSRVICPRCGATYESRDFGNLARFEGEPHSAGFEPEDVIKTKLAELDELIEGLQAEIEALRSRELSAPLQIGCSFFSLFIAVTIVLAASMLLGRSYFGSWVFYVCLAVVVLFGVARLRRKLKERVPAGQIRRERLELEESLADLRRERDRVQHLRTSLISDDEPNLI
jgi:hypothetical protein